MRLDEPHRTGYVRHAVDGRRDREVVHDGRLVRNVRKDQIYGTYVWTQSYASAFRSFYI